MIIVYLPQWVKVAAALMSDQQFTALDYNDPMVTMMLPRVVMPEHPGPFLVREVL